MRERKSLKQAAKWVCALDRALAAEIAQEVLGDELPEMIRRGRKGLVSHIEEPSPGATRHPLPEEG